MRGVETIEPANTTVEHPSPTSTRRPSSIDCAKENAMLSRWSVVLFVVGVVAGYALAGPAVRAQSEGRPPFAIEDVITIRYERLPGEHVGRSVECKVLNVIGNYVRCAPENASDRSEVWYSLRSVVQIVRHQR
jgi:hypothetical protein